MFGHDLNGQTDKIAVIGGGILLVPGYLTFEQREQEREIFWVDLRQFLYRNLALPSPDVTVCILQILQRTL